MNYDIILEISNVVLFSLFAVMGFAAGRAYEIVIGRSHERSDE